LSVRYRLRDLATFKKIMGSPGRGTPFTVRDLAETAGVSRSQIGRLLTGDLKHLDVNDAHAVTEALGVAVLVLFMPPASPNEGHADNRTSPT